MPYYVLTHQNSSRNIQALEEPVYSEKFRGWRFSNRLIIDPDREYTVEAFDADPPPPPPAPPPEWEWLLDNYQLIERLGAAEDDVVTSTDARARVAWAKLMAMPYIDLQWSRVGALLNRISNRVPTLTPEIVNGILSTKPTNAENRFTRKLYFGG